MPVATKIAPWASQESSAQLHNFPRFFFPTLRLSIGGVEKEHQNLERKVLSMQPQRQRDTPQQEIKGFTLWLVQDKAVCLTCSQHSKHFHFSFHFSSPSTLYLIFRKKCAPHSMSLNMLGGLITSELLIHCPTVQLHHVLWWRTHRALCCSSTNTKQHPSLMATLHSSSKTKPGVCLEDGRWQLHTETTCTITHFNNSYLDGNESKPRVWFCPGAVSVMKMLPHHNTSKIAILRQNWLKGNVDPWRF